MQNDTRSCTRDRYIPTESENLAEPSTLKATTPTPEDVSCTAEKVVTGC